MGRTTGLEKRLLVFLLVFTAILLAVTALIVVVAGGDEEDDSAVTTEVASAPGTPPPTAESEFAKQFVTDYFAEINAGQFGNAWARLSRRVKDKFGSYNRWRNRYSRATGINLFSTSAAVDQGGEVSFVASVGATVPCNGQPFGEIRSGPVVVSTSSREISAIRLDERSSADPAVPIPSGC